MNTMFTALLAICGNEERPLPALAGQAPGDAVQHSADLRSTTFLDGALLVLGMRSRRQALLTMGAKLRPPNPW
jgi:hypothetical protein